jgi:hypothetical protein
LCRNRVAAETWALRDPPAARIGFARRNSSRSAHQLKQTLRILRASRGHRFWRARHFCVRRVAKLASFARENWDPYLQCETIALPRKELAQSAPKGALQKCVTLEFYERFARVMQNPARKNS